MNGQRMALADALTVLDAVGAVHDGEPAYAEALINTMGVGMCAVTAVGLLDLFVDLVADQSGMAHADALAHLRQFLELGLT